MRQYKTFIQIIVIIIKEKEKKGIKSKRKGENDSGTWETACGERK